MAAYLLNIFIAFAAAVMVAPATRVVACPSFDVPDTWIVRSMSYPWQKTAYVSYTTSDGKEVTPYFVQKRELI